MVPSNKAALEIGIYQISRPRMPDVREGEDELAAVACADGNAMFVMRILIIEDNAQREKLLRSWIPPGARAVIAKSAGRAIGILERDRGRVYSGIVLDHDLQEKPATEADRYLSGQDLVDRIISVVCRDVPILVHSVNASQGWVMAVRLKNQGFEVTHIPMNLLTAGVFEEWVQEVREACGANE